MLRVRQRVRGVGVDLKRHVSKALADGADRLNVPARLDLQLDAAVALVEVAGHGLQELGDGAVDADRHTAVDLRPDGAEIPPERLARGTKLGVQDGHLDRGLGLGWPWTGRRMPATSSASRRWRRTTSAAGGG